MSNILSVKHNLYIELSKAVKKSQAEGKLPSVPVPDIGLEHPQRPEHGDIATNLPLKLARAMAMKPLDIACEIAESLSDMEEFSRVEAVAPGFINLTFSSSWLNSQVNSILTDQDNYTRLDIGNGEKVQVEFVSVNPTGPLHVGHGRGAVLGSTLSNVLRACGFDVYREYYINDAGNQIDLFKHSLYIRYMQALDHSVSMPQEGYFGKYMFELAHNIIQNFGRNFESIPKDEAVNELGEIGLQLMVDNIRHELELLRVEFDEWFSEKTLYQKSDYQKAMAILKEGDYLSKKELATWFDSTALGDNKDNVIVRSDGSPTYFAADIAYHYNKFVTRGFERVIDIWGADHQGHVSRMKAVIEALGLDRDKLEIIISQMVTLKRGGDLVRISKRSGEMITLKEVIDEVGKDACRFFFLSRSANSQMDFDLELALRESPDNPVYYIQYAHARIASILRLAKEENIDFSGGDTGLLNDPSELALIRGMVELPEVIELVAKSLEPHHLAYYSQNLATLFHSFYKQCRVVQRDNIELTCARLKLVVAAKTIFASALTLMGMSVPESM